MVSGNAVVADTARVYGAADIYGDAQVCDNAVVRDYAKIHGYSRIFGFADVAGYAMIFDYASVSGNAFVSGNAKISGRAKVSGLANISGFARVHYDAVVTRAEGCQFVRYIYPITITETNIVIGCFSWYSHADCLAVKFKHVSNNVSHAEFLRLRRLIRQLMVVVGSRPSNRKKVRRGRK